MIDLANLFIVVLLAGAAWLGVSALVQKRTARRGKDELPRRGAADAHDSNHAA